MSVPLALGSCGGLHGGVVAEAERVLADAHCITQFMHEGVVDVRIQGMRSLSPTRYGMTAIPWNTITRGANPSIG